MPVHGCVCSSTRLQFANSPPVEITSRVAGVDNAREAVDPSGGFKASRRAMGRRASSTIAGFICRRLLRSVCTRTSASWRTSSSHRSSRIRKFTTRPGTEMSVVVTQQATCTGTADTQGPALASERSEELERFAAGHGGENSVAGRQKAAGRYREPDVRRFGEGSVASFSDGRVGEEQAAQLQDRFP